MLVKGELYEGDFVDGKRSGKGRLRFEELLENHTGLIKGGPLVTEIVGTFSKENREATEGRLVMYQDKDGERFIHCDFTGTIFNRKSFRGEGKIASGKELIDVRFLSVMPIKK